MTKNNCWIEAPLDCPNDVINYLPIHFFDLFMNSVNKELVDVINLKCTWVFYSKSRAGKKQTYIHLLICRLSPITHGLIISLGNFNCLISTVTFAHPSNLFDVVGLQGDEVICFVLQSMWGFWALGCSFSPEFHEIPLLGIDKVRLPGNIQYCYIAGIFPLIARALIGQFGITWHLTMKLFPAKSLWLWATLQSLLRQRVTMQCYPRMLTEDRRCRPREQNVVEGGVIIAFSAFFKVLYCNGDSFTLCWFVATRNCRPCGRERFQKHTVSDKNCLVYIKSLLRREISWQRPEFWRNFKRRTKRTPCWLLSQCKEKTGGNYKKTALTSIRFGLQRYFNRKRGFNIIADGAFEQSNQVFEAVVVQLKRQGFAKVDHHEPIKKEDLAKIYSSYDQSSPSPKSLQQFVWFNIMYHLIRRGRENLRLHTKQSVCSQLTRPDENMSTRSRMNSTKTTGKTMIPLILQGMEECTKTRIIQNYAQ